MAQAPNPTNSVPATPPPAAAGAEARVTVGARSGWRFADGSIVFDDGEKIVPPSGKSDAEKRAEALAAVLGTLPALHEGAAAGDIERLRSESTRVQSPDVNAARRAVAKEIAALPPASDSVIDKRLKSIPPSAEEQLAQLRVVARGLIDAELVRIEQLKEMAIGHNLVVGRDGQPVRGNVPQLLHDLILNAVSVVQRGDLKHIADALRELKRWSVIGAPDA